MKKGTQIIVILGIFTCVVLTFLNLLKINQSSALSDKTTSKLTENLLVPEKLTSLELTDLQNNQYEIFSSESSYKLLIFGSPGCEACALLLKDIYLNEQKFIEKSIDINFIWLNTGSEVQRVSDYLEEKVVSYTSQSIQHLTMSLEKYQSIGFNQGPIPLISIYNVDGELRFQSYGYSIAIVDQMINVDNFKNPFIQGWEQE